MAKVKTRVKTETRSRDDAIRDVVLDIVANVIERCIYTDNSGVDCILRHIETVERGALHNYMSNELRETYEALNDADKNIVKYTALEKLEKYVDRLCEVYRNLYRENKDDICNHL